MFTAFSDACIHPFPPIWCKPVKSWRSDRNSSPDEPLSIGLGQKNWHMLSVTISVKLSNNEMTSSVQQRTLAALVKKTFLHFHCCKTTDELEWAGYNRMWPAWAFVQSQQYCVFINPAKLYWTATVNKYFSMHCMDFQSFCSLCSTSNHSSCAYIINNVGW
jgi:hypothetical protein